MTTRLATLSPLLAAAVSQSERPKKVAALHYACACAVSECGLGGAEYDDALTAIGSGVFDTALGQRLSELSGEFDDLYFELNDERSGEHTSPDAMALFRKSRAASALAFALSGDQAFDEAIYEAIYATHQPDALAKDILQRWWAP